MKRNVLSQILSGLLLLSVLPTLVLFVLEPSSLAFRVLLSVVAIISLLGVGVILSSFQKFFGERREMGKRLVTEVRLHRAETKLLRSELDKAVGALSAGLGEAGREIERAIEALPLADRKKVQELVSAPLRAHRTEISSLRSEMKEAFESLSSLTPQITRELEESIRHLPLADWGKVEEFVALTTKDTVRELRSLLQPLQNSSKDAELSNTLAALEEEIHAIARLLNNVQSTQESILPRMAEHYSIRSKQLVSIVDAQRQELTGIRAKAEQLLHSRRN